MHRIGKALLLCAAWLAATRALAQQEPMLRVPAFTAYVEPESGAQVSERGGITRWESASTRILWFGELKHAGKLEAAVVLRLPVGQVSRLRLRIGSRAHEVSVAGAAAPVTASFGEYRVGTPGYVRVELASLNDPGQPAGDLDALLLSGAAADQAHFNLNERRNAASVHLKFPLPEDTQAALFYNEIRAVDDPVATYYMACGFARGYFGMQVNSPTERRIIFSVWDAATGQTANNRSEVAPENHVQLLSKGEGVVASVFGGEGTGGHSHLVYPWKTGSHQRFAVTARPSGTFTDYSGYWFHPEERRWKLIASFRAPKDGKYLRGLYSFNEDFDGGNGHLRRKAVFGPQWIRTPAGDWKELTETSFSHDPTGKSDRLDRCMGLDHGLFYLSNGGYVAGSTPFGQKFTRPATARPPQDLASLPAQ